LKKYKEERLLQTSSPGLPRYWPLLFPLTYLVHIAEEYWCGGGFYNWARVLGMQMDGTRFLRINAVAWTVMLVLSLLAVSLLRARWVMISFAAAVLLNGLAHTTASIGTTSYSPGLVSGLLLWVPLGAYTLRRAFAETSRRTFWGAVVWGLALHALVTFIALIR
jgi:Protein of unknown function with HXXEE motif